MRSASKRWRVLFAILTVAAVGYAANALLDQYREFRASGLRLTIRWGSLAGASALVVVSYGVLIETWRRVVRKWDSELGYWDAAYIWVVSNLGKYLPGKVWTIAAMGAMAQEKGVSPIAATGSSILINLVNVVVGFGVTLITGSAAAGISPTSVAVISITVLGILALPRMLPSLAALASRLTGRAISMPALPTSAIWTAAAGCSIGWLLYGTAFQLFTRSLLGTSPGSTGAYIAAFTGSYLGGYIALFAPGGIGAREGFLLESLKRLALPPGGAGIVVFGSRLWLTALEVIPGVIFLAAKALKRNRISNS